MPENNQDNKAPKRNKKRIWLAVGIVFLVALISYHFLARHSAEEKLAAIDAAHAIPDSENAAIIYDQVFTDYQTPQIPWNSTDPKRRISALLIFQPWHSSDYPELAKWIEQHQGLMGKLLEACKLDKCWFPITDKTATSLTIARTPIIRAQTAHQWAYLLALAANNDMAEGRIQNAIEKYRAIMQLGRHFRQQPITSDFQIGTRFEVLSLRPLTRLVVQDDLTESQIKNIESFLPQPEIDWDEMSATMLPIQRILDRRLPLLTRAKYWVQSRRSGMRLPDEDEQMEGIGVKYLQLIARYRAATITIALRRHKNKTGKWPGSLEEIKSLAPAETFIDPINGGSFAYILAGETFELYSKGQNKIDEDGQATLVRDPNTFQETLKEDDILFWPTITRKTQKTEANTHPPDPNAKESG
ncbi:MAG: hypothetical protein ACYS8Z_26400 [Planctomycetota bacterium]|jgi:hypothetical protein